MKPLIDDLKVLATEGVTINIHGFEKTFQGALLLCLGDNLGSNAMGGFKQSYSFSFRFCRSCYITNSEYKTYSDSSDLELCCNEKHEHECNLLTGPLYDHYSKTYGINKRSALMDIPFYSMFSGCLPHDIMHDVLEGIVPLELSLLLKYCILSENFLSLIHIKHRLTTPYHPQVEY